MPAPIAIQLYSIREHTARDFEGSLRKIASFGYAGVEPAGFPGTTPEAAGKLFHELGLQAPSAHTPMPLGEKQAEVLDAMQAIGCKRIISGFGPDSYKTMDLLKDACEKFNQASLVAKDNGLRFGIHNHWWEFEQLDGRYVYEHMLELLDPEIFFELDTYWIQTAGVNAAEKVAEFGARAPFLHIKDGPCEVKADQVAVGEGVMDVPAVVKAGAQNTEWLVVELDRTDGDMFTAVERSIQYLIGEGLGHGR
jgi:sugar phosphate isomerase/epimerase